MLTNITRTLFCATAVVFICLYVVNANATIGQTARISNGDAVTGSGNPSISANGRFVAFVSDSKSLTTGDNNNAWDVFVHDRVTHQTNRVSIASSGEQGNKDSNDAFISADGRYVAFSSSADNLVTGDTNQSSDIFVHDRLFHKTTRVSISSSLTQGDGSSGTPSISANGRFVAFESKANNLVVNDTNFLSWDTFVHDRLTHQTKRVNVSSTGEEAYEPISYAISQPKISANGRFVSFASSAINLVPNDTNNLSDIFVHDIQTHQTKRVSVSSSGAEITGGPIGSVDATISADGRFTAFTIVASNLGSGIFVHDSFTGQTTPISPFSNSLNGEGLSRVSNPGISANGRYVAFIAATPYPDLKAGLYINDRVTHLTTPLSVSSAGVLANSIMDFSLPFTGPSSINADGRYVAFGTYADNLVLGDFPGSEDVFVRDRVLNNAVHADLKLTVTEKPASLVLNYSGNYTFEIANNGPNAVNNVSLTYLVENGNLISFTPSQGACRRNAISLCNFGKILPGHKLTLQVVVQAKRNALTQKVTVSGAPIDNAQGNNFATITTKVNNSF